MTQNFYKKYLIGILIVTAIIFLNGYFFDNFLQDTVYRIVDKPGVFLTRHLLNVSKYASVFLNTKSISDENARLKQENHILLGQLAELDNLKRENKVLRDGLGVARRLGLPLLLVQIFNIQKSPLSSTALINKGSKDSIKKSLPVVATGNVLVGIVEQVFDNSAVILLLDDPRVRISGRVQETNVLVQTRGELQDSLSLELVANTDEINEGNTVLTSGLDGLPESLLIARITDIESTNSALFKTIHAKPFFDPSLGSSLFVVLQ